MARFSTLLLPRELGTPALRSSERTGPRPRSGPWSRSPRLCQHQRADDGARSAAALDRAQHRAFHPPGCPVADHEREFRRALRFTCSLSRAPRSPSASSAKSLTSATCSTSSPSRCCRTSGEQAPDEWVSLNPLRQFSHELRRSVDPNTMAFRKREMAADLIQFLNEQIGRRGTSGSGTRSCPDCAETIKAAARVCRYCGARLDSDAN